MYVSHYFRVTYSSCPDFVFVTCQTTSCRRRKTYTILHHRDTPQTQSDKISMVFASFTPNLHSRFRFCILVVVVVYYPASMQSLQYSPDVRELEENLRQKNFFCQIILFNPIPHQMGRADSARLPVTQPF